jgi:hypothetical protein
VWANGLLFRIGCDMFCVFFFTKYAEAVLQFAKLNTAAQQREAVVQG